MRQVIICKDSKLRNINVLIIFMCYELAFVLINLYFLFEWEVINQLVMCNAYLLIDQIFLKY
jgi:hypothetical protein